MQTKTKDRTIGLLLLAVGTLLFLLTWRFRSVSNWPGFLPGAAAIVLLIGSLFLIRWYFHPESNTPKWKRTLWAIVGVLLCIFSLINGATFGGLGAGIFGY